MVAVGFSPRNVGGNVRVAEPTLESLLRGPFKCRSATRPTSLENRGLKPTATIRRPAGTIYFTVSQAQSERQVWQEGFHEAKLRGEERSEVKLRRGIARNDAA